MKTKTLSTLSTLFRSLPLLLLFLILRVNVKAQGPTPVPPDCQIFISSWTSARSSASFANYYTGCTSWTLQYTSVGFSGLTLTLQSAPAATATTPSTFVSYAGTVITGVNPNTSTTGAVTTFSNGAVDIPWVRVTLSGLTGSGTVFGVLYGYKTGYTGGAGTPGSGCASPCTVIQPTASLLNAQVQGPGAAGAALSGNPIQVGGSDGTNTRTLSTDTSGRLVPGAYASSAALSLSSSGLTQIIAAGAGVTTVSHVSASFASGVDFQLEYGTGSNCGTGTTALSGVYKTVLTIALETPFVVPSGKALCVNLGASVAGGGLVVYAQP